MYAKSCTLVLATLVLAGCTSSSESRVVIQIGTAYSDGGDIPGKDGFKIGEPAPGAVVEILALDAATFPQEITMSSPAPDAKWGADQELANGGTVRLGNSENAVRFHMTLDSVGHGSFQVERDGAIRLSMSVDGGYLGRFGDCERYYGSTGQPERFEATHDATVKLPFIVQCSYPE